MIHYKGYKIEKVLKPIPSRKMDWDYVHEDYDGPEDNRCGCAASIEECKSDIDEIISEDNYISLETWLDQWESAVLDGQSSISRDEAVNRWEKEYG